MWLCLHTTTGIRRPEVFAEDFPAISDPPPGSSQAVMLEFATENWPPPKSAVPARLTPRFLP